MIDTIDNSFSFPKYYYTRNNELLFSSELRGICNIEKKKNEKIFTFVSFFMSYFLRMISSYKKKIETYPEFFNYTK